MKLIVERSNLVHAPSHPRFGGRNLRSKDDMDDLPNKLWIMHPFARPELLVTAHHLRFEILHAPKINQTDRAVFVEQIIARMRVGMERLDLQELKEKQVRQASPQLVAQSL